MLTAVLCTALALTWPRPCAAQADTLTLEQALALARERAPPVLSARRRIEDARGRVTGASAWFRENPVLEGGLDCSSLNHERGEP